MKAELKSINKPVGDMYLRDLVAVLRLELYKYLDYPYLEKYTRAGVTSCLNLSIGHYAGGMKREP